MRTNRIVIHTIAVATLVAAHQCWAQTATSQSLLGESLTITVTGEAKGLPDAMHIEFVSEAVAGNVSDAFRQCKEKADAAERAIRSLKIPDSQVSRQMYEFSSPPPSDSFGMGRPAAVPALLKVLQPLYIKVKLPPKSERERLAETVSRVFESAFRNGVALRQSPAWPRQYPEVADTAIAYVLEDATPLTKQAIADAFRKANEMKESLIASGVRPGRLIGVMNSPIGQAEFTSWARPLPGKSVFGPKAAVSTSPEEVTVYSTLIFTYKIESPQK